MENGVLFTGLDDFSNDEVIWSGYEAEYPDDIGEIDWTNLHDFVGAVVNSDQETFDSTVINRISVENMADYFIFLNMVFAADNTGKNIITGRYDSDEPYFYSAWDMDGSFGNDWQGDRVDISEEILANGLHSKLLENEVFKAEVKARWASLRAQTLQTAELQKRFTDLYAKLNGNGVYEREALDEELPRKYSEQEIDFITAWIQRRADYLDMYFLNL